MKNFNLLPEFAKEFKRLFRKCATLDEDLEKFKKVLLKFPTGVGRNFVVIHSTEAVKIVKSRMACAALRGNSLRIVYAYIPQTRTIEFIRIYREGDREREDGGGIKKYMTRHRA